MNVTRTAAAASFAAASALLAACSQSASAPPSPTTSTVEDTVTQTQTVTAAPVTTTPISTESSTPATATKSATAVAVKHNTCPDGTLTVRVLPGGAIRGHEIAAVTVTNSGTRPCVVWGFPKVHLERGGKLLGAAAVPTGTAHDLTLAPGDQAQALITDASTCNAPLSDTVVATLPESTQTVSRPMEMRGCSLQIAALGPPQ